MRIALSFFKNGRLVARVRQVLGRHEENEKNASKRTLQPQPQGEELICFLREVGRTGEARQLIATVDRHNCRTN